MKKSLSYFVLAVSICTASLLQQQKLIQLPLSTNDPPTIILPPIIIRPATENHLTNYNQVVDEL